MKNEFIYGNNPVADFLRDHSDRIVKLYLKDQLHNARKKEFKQLAGTWGVPIQQVPEIKLRKLVGKVNHQGVVAEISFVAYTSLEHFLENLDLESSPFLLALDHITDPHNFGACIRSAAASGAKAVLFPQNDQVGLTGTVLKTSAGTAASIPLIRVAHLNQALASFRDLGFRIYGLDAGGEATAWESSLTDASIFVIGAEGAGISAAVKKHCDEIISFPLSQNVESLNASVTAGLILFEARRQRLEREPQAD